MNRTRYIAILSVIYTTISSVAGEQAIYQLRVVDDEQEPVAKAKVYLAFQTYHRDRHHEMLLETSEDGKLTAIGWPKDKYLVSIYTKISKPGFYTSIREHHAGLDDRKWDVETLLRKKVAPIAMYAKKVDAEIPEPRKEIGFDFQKGDWVKPYGKGEIPDCTFIAEKFYEDRDNYKTTVIMSFPEDGCGILLDPAAQDRVLTHSKFKTSREAPLIGYKEIKKFVAVKSEEDGYEGSTRKASYLMKTRPVFDQNGDMESYNYGKLVDAVDVQRAAGVPDKNPTVSFTYYFNPTPNDRNLEFDPDQNLFGELEQDEVVREP